MFPISKILVPVDFSDRNRGMLFYVNAIASKYKAEVTLLHVVNPLYTIPATGPFGPILISIPPSVFAEAGKHLDTFGADQLNGVGVRRLVYEGDPVEQIVELAQAEHTDLIIMPTHGYGALRRFLIGSVTAKVLHDATCPVLTAAHVERPTGDRPGAFSKVLCALNLGPESARTLSWAAQLANDLHAHLGIVHAIASKSGHEREDLERLQKSVGAKVDTVSIQEGDAVDTVCSVARSTGADLLVIGRGTVDHTPDKLKTNAYAIIRHAPCPVVSV